MRPYLPLVVLLTVVGGCGSMGGPDARAIEQDIHRNTGQVVHLREVVLDVTHICPFACLPLVKRNLEVTPGVHAVWIDESNARAVVISEVAVDPDALVRAIAREGPATVLAVSE